MSIVSIVEKKLKKGGLTGISVGAVALLACDLPLVLTSVGLGTLSAGASVLRPPFWIEVIGIAAAVVGLLMVIVLVIRRSRNRNEQSVE